jgi:aminoglycoside 3-N-acetyltransferase
VTFNQLKQPLKNLRSELRHIYARIFYPCDAAMLLASLKGLGINQDDTVFVHSSYNAFRGFNGKPSDVISALENAVGPGGTILMPSMPFTGTAIEYVRSGAITDLRSTPSRMGMVTEVFRRQKGTLRSISATHPVLGRGAKAATIIAGHEHASSPCGSGSPFSKLLEVDGKILFLGASIDSMTFFHYLEEKFETQLRASPFTSDYFNLEVRSNGKSVFVKTRLFDPALARRRQVSLLLPELQAIKGLSRARVGVVSLLLIRARSVCQAFEAVLKKGECFYGEE